MATPTFNLNLNVISACDADDWDGGVGILDTVIFKQNAASLSLAVRDGGTAGYTHPTTSWDMSATDTHIRMWVIHTFVTNLELKANGGIQLYVKDTSNNYNYYYVSGSDTHPGSWELVQADLTNPDVDGSANLALIDEFGWEIVHATAARNIVNTWWDYCVFGTGYEVKGGVNSDPVTWDTLAAADLALGYGVVTLDRGVFFVNAAVDLGDTVGTDDLYFDGTGELVVFYSANESATLYKITGVGNGTGTTEIDMSGTVFKSDSNRFAFDMSATNVDVFLMDGSKLDYAGLSTFKAGQTITNTVFNDCLQADPSTSTFTRNNFSKSVDTSGTVLWPTDSTNIHTLTFSICDNDIEYDAASDATPLFHNIVHDDNAGDYDVNNTSGASIEIPLTGTSNSNSYNPGGDIVTFSASVTLTFTVTDETSGSPIQYARINIVNASTKAELYQIETNVSGIATQSHTYAGELGIEGWCRQFDISGEDYASKDWAGTIKSTGFDANIVLSRI